MLRLSYRRLYIANLSNPLKSCVVYIAFCLAVFNTQAQYYLRGEIKDEMNQPLQNVKIFLHSNHYLYYSGPEGSFGITTLHLNDSVTLSLEGYESKTVPVNCQQWQSISMHVTSSNIYRNKPRLISVTKDLKQTTKPGWIINDETYFQLFENEYVNARNFPNTGITLNVNKASYSNVRRFINMGSPAPPDAVRIEELLNYFNLHYHEPEKDKVFNMESQLSSCPWDAEKQLLFVNINAKKLDLDKVPPGNFVFLIDASGSMDLPNRLPLLKAAFQLFVRNLRPIDTVSIVAYGGTVGIWMQPTSGAEKEKIIKSIEELTASGDTPGQSAIMTAYDIARSTYIKGGNNRVILATDGDFNVGLSSEKELNELITKEKQSGIYLTCLGVGMGNFKDSKLETLAKRGNGNYAYLDDINEAEKVLVRELTQNFYAVADDVFLNLQFNPAKVKQYRLIGFDNRRDAIQNKIIDLEGGEIGSGNSTIAIFEIIPEADSLAAGGIADLSLRYSRCHDTSHQQIRYTCPANVSSFYNLDKELRFASAVAMFGLKLKQSEYIKLASWEDIQSIALNSYDTSSFLQTEFLQLVEKAKKIYREKKKKKKNIE